MVFDPGCHLCEAMGEACGEHDDTPIVPLPPHDWRAMVGDREYMGRGPKPRDGEIIAMGTDGFLRVAQEMSDLPEQPDLWVVTSLFRLGNEP